MLQATLPMFVPPPSPIRPPTNRTDAAPALQPALQQPALRHCARRCGLIDDEANGVVADAACGDGCRACAGRHHGEPRLQAGPHPRSARHAPSAACDVGFSQKQAVQRHNLVRHRRHGQHRRRGQRHRRVRRPRAVSAADVPARGSPDTARRGCAPVHVRRRRAIRARKKRGSGRLPTCWPGSPAARST